MACHLVLRYEPPVHFQRNGIGPPADYASTQFNASIQVYPFRPFRGDLGSVVRMTLLRHWIDPRFQESHATPQTFGTLVVPGAEQALSAQFVEQVGLPRQHLRVFVAVGGAVAIVDFGAAARIWAQV